MLVFIGAWVASGILTHRAILVQRIEPQDAASNDLFGGESSGEPGTRIGSPQRALIWDSAVYLSGTGPREERFISEVYLKSKGTYSVYLQEKTLLFFRDMMVLVSGLGALSLGTLWWFLGRFRTKQALGS